MRSSHLETALSRRKSKLDFDWLHVPAFSAPAHAAVSGNDFPADGFAV
jgi:hypothetical protein